MKQIFISISIVLTIVLFESFKSPSSKINADSVEIINNEIDGKQLFTQNNCVACHNITVKTVGPSIAEIAKVYAGKKNELIKFLNGEKEAIVDPAQFAMMKPQLNITKKMNDAERIALAKYMLAKK
jgi:cytochrome c